MTGRASTPAQHRARMRNWGIRSLRALYSLSYQLSPARRDIVLEQIDAELKERGAKTYAEQVEAYRHSIGEN